MDDFDFTDNGRGGGGDEEATKMVDQQFIASIGTKGGTDEIS